MESAWNFDSTFNMDFGSSGAELLIYREWKIPKIADFSPRAARSMSQTSTPQRRLLFPNDLGTSNEPPRSASGLGGRSRSTVLTDFQDF